MRDLDVGSIRYFVLGPLRVRGPDGEIADVPRGKLNVLLAALLLRRDRWVDSRDLIEAMWGDSPQKSSQANLKTYIFRLRSRLNREGAESPISSAKGGYRLTVAAGELDADVFEHLVAEGKRALGAGDPRRAEEALTAALALWRGDPEFAEDETGEEARLRAVRRDARLGRAECRTAAGRPDEAVPDLRALLAENPIDEPSWELLIRALLEDGRHAEASSEYDEAKRRIEDATGGSFGPRLRALRSRLVPGPEDDDGSTASAKPAVPGTPDDATAAVPSAGAVAPPRDDLATPRTESGPPAGNRPRRPSRPRNRWVPIAALTTCAVLLIAAAVTGPVLFGGADDPDAAVPAELRLGATAPKRRVPDRASPGAAPTLRFGLGSAASTAAQQRLVADSPIGMYTTWYDGPEALPRFEGWSRDLIPGYYAENKAMHLIVTPGYDEPEPFDTPRGPACGLRYPLSDRFLDDMRQLATSFAGKATGPPLYVSVSDGPEKMLCGHDTGYNADPQTRNYLDAFKDRYRETRQIFHRYAPNARVALNWNGWQGTYDDPDTGAGRSFLRYFSDVLAVSDFQSFNAHQDERNYTKISRMVDQLGEFGPVMVSEFGPYRDETGALTRSDLEHVFAPEQIAKLTADGLFAWSFREEEYVERTPEIYALSRDIVRRYAGTPGAP